MSDDFIEIESKAELQDAINKTSMVILFCTVDGRDAVNASAGEEFEAYMLLLADMLSLCCC